MAFDWFREGDLEVDPAAVQVLEIKALSCRVALVFEIRNMPQRSPGDVATARQMSREGGDILQHDGGIPHAGRKGVRGERVTTLEERSPCCPTIPKDAVDGRRGGIKGSTSPLSTPVNRSEMGDELLLALLVLLLLLVLDLVGEGGDASGGG